MIACTRCGAGTVNQCTCVPNHWRQMDITEFSGGEDFRFSDAHKAEGVEGSVFLGRCECGPKATCPICKDEKLAAGISPKHDAGKLRYSLVPPIAIKSLAEVLTFGAEKYAPNSWQGVENGEARYMDALYRHLEDFRAGEKLDKDSGLSHLAHAMTNLAFLCHFEQEKSNDDS